MKLLTIKEAAAVLGVAPDGIRDLIAERALPVVRVSARRLRVKERDLVEFVDRRTIRAVAQ